MSFGDILYTIIIGPLELFFEVVFVIANNHVSNPAFAIILLSLAMNFLVLPLYRRADALQAEERDRENALAPWIKHIKKTFKGDERFMMLQAFYRENNYKPTDSLKGSVSLFLEIPFFIAAYHFLSHLQTLKGVSFGPIADLGAPDALITIGTMSINLLPILMTLINVVSAAIYMKGFPLKSKVQMYGVALIFLVFLYKSPAGLVFYWTLNNLFSLVKNIFYKIPNPQKVLKIVSSVVGGILLIIVLFIHPMPSKRAQVLVVAALLCLQMPLLKREKSFKINIADGGDSAKIFYASTVFMTILTGILIPSAVISDSTEEFLSISGYYSPYWYIISAFTIAFGTFVVWFTIFFRLASSEGRMWFSLIMAIASVVGATNYMFFGKDYGNFSSVLVYDKVPSISAKGMLVNLLVAIVLAIIVSCFFFNKRPIINAVTVAMCLALIVMSGLNIINIQSNLTKSASIIKAASESEPEINLSQNGKNVVVIMMDRQIGHFVPFIMHEKPELKEMFKGFTYYSNSFSYGTFTNFGSPGLYGGYEYIPSEMNKRDKVKLVDKHNEALKVMPKMFSDAGYSVTVMDPTYAGYAWVPDLSIFNDIPGVEKSISMGKFSLEELSYETTDEKEKKLRKRNFFLYGIFKTAPQIVQPTIYAKGSYNAPATEGSKIPQVIISDTEAEGTNEGFLRSYAVLSHMPDITNKTEAEEGAFIMMSNDVTHEPMLLQEPEYVPKEKVNNNAGSEYMIKEDDDGNVMRLEDQNSLIHYQTNVAAMLKLGEWLDYLKDIGVYDNTRIIIVSDHGRDINDNVLPRVTYTDEKNNKKEMWPAMFDCALLVKDFDSQVFTVKENLISNADTPAIATKDLIKNPINPYTGNQIEQFDDQSEAPKLIYSFDWQTDKNDGKEFLPSDWFTVNDSIYIQDNWKYIGHH